MKKREQGGQAQACERGSGYRKQGGRREAVECPTEPEHSGRDNSHKHVYLKDNMSPTVFLPHREVRKRPSL